MFLSTGSKEKKVCERARKRENERQRERRKEGNATYQLANQVLSVHTQLSVSFIPRYNTLHMQRGLFMLSFYMIAIWQGLITI